MVLFLLGIDMVNMQVLPFSAVNALGPEEPDSPDAACAVTLPEVCLTITGQASAPFLDEEQL